MKVAAAGRLPVLLFVATTLAWRVLDRRAMLFMPALLTALAVIDVPLAASLLWPQRLGLFALIIGGFTVYWLLRDADSAAVRPASWSILTGAALWPGALAIPSLLGHHLDPRCVVLGLALSAGIVSWLVLLAAGVSWVYFAQTDGFAQLLWIVLAALVAALVRNLRLPRYGGFVLLGLALLKLSIWDLRELESTLRVIVLVCVGISLVLASFFYAGTISLRRIARRRIVRNRAAVPLSKLRVTSATHTHR